MILKNQMCYIYIAKVKHGLVFVKNDEHISSQGLAT